MAKKPYMGKTRPKANAIEKNRAKHPDVKKTKSTPQKPKKSKRRSDNEAKSTNSPKLHTNINKEQVSKAVKALLHHIDLKNQARKKQQLIEEAAVLSVIITLFKIPDGTNKPYSLPIKHTLRQEDETSVCIIVKDGSVKHVKDRLTDIPTGVIIKVLGLSKLREKYHEHKTRRELCSKYDLFIADDRILPMLTKALGTVFFRKKKQPVPMRVMRKNIYQNICTIRDSTSLFLGLKLQGYNLLDTL